MSRILGIHPALLRSAIWFAALLLLHLVLSLYWSNKMASCSSAAVSQSLMTMLLLERALLELYSSFYVSSSSSAPRAAALFRGRAALWVRLVLSLTLLTTCFLSSMEGASEVFQFEVTPHSTHGSSTTSDEPPPPPQDKASIMRHRAFVEGAKSPLEVAHEHYHQDRVAESREKVIEAQNRRRQRSSNNNRGDDKKLSFSDGAIDPYHALIQTVPLCGLWTGIVSAVIVFLIHSLAAVGAHSVTVHTYYRPLQKLRRHRDNHGSSSSSSSDKKNEEEGATGGSTVDSADLDALEADAPLWALQTELLTELQISSSVLFFVIALHWAAQQWALNAGDEVPAYLAFLTGSTICYFESFAVAAVVRALTLSLTPGEARLVESLEKEMAKSLTSASVSAVRAFKTQRGQIGLVVECDNVFEGGDGGGVREEIVALLKLHATWERFVDSSLIFLR